ncbi:MAG: hypothetical protein Q8R97_11295 [Brevundimonas sp.]|uniref:hypothetical protein n=1 Tax=Brevundimonas sp. TaxID=1871086 RepID=UPI00276FEE81|nr:hypothetical protein [Brevundimonas sp.]MDP3401695.1 hypothetical protein [Brevundimonas sp.]MDZ4110988.1 hypothetical protein [Brevundimonas sp.]
MRILFVALGALSLAACATPVPQARPLNADQIAAMGPTRVLVVENDYGIGKSWLMSDSSVAAAPYGLIGVLVSAGIDAMMNYGPSARASQAADEVAEVISLDALNTSLTQSLQAQVPASAPRTGVSLSDVSPVQRVTSVVPEDDAIEVVTSYTLSTDASALRITVTSTYSNASLPYATPYFPEGSPPKSELAGPTYRNTFVYESRQLPLPVLTPELKEELVASIRESARDETGALPEEGTDAHRAMTKELEDAVDSRLTDAEIAFFLTREWLKDDGRLIRAEIDNAHALAARYLVMDLNRTDVPSYEGEGSELVETLPDGRTVYRFSGGLMAGSYVSSPADGRALVNYGNAINYASVHMTRLQTLRTEAREQRQ